MIEKWKSELVGFAVNKWLYYEKYASGVPSALFCKFCMNHILLQSKNCHLRNIRKYLNMKNFTVSILAIPI